MLPPSWVHAAEHDKINVTATFSISGDWISNIAGDKVEVNVLVGADADVHTFEPTPRDMKALRQTDVIFENGAGLESWLDDLYVSSRSKAKRVVLTQSLPLIEAVHDGEGEGHNEHSHQHADQDPHFWHDVTLVIKAVERVRDEMIDMDSRNTESYQRNTEEYITRLKELDHWIRMQVDKIPPERRVLITSHDSFGYFSRRYGFRISSAAVDSFTTEAFDPSAAQLARMIKKIKDDNIPAVFTENMFNPQLIESIAKETGVKTAPPLYTGALGVEGSEGDSYIKMMRYNTNQIVDALK